LLGFYILDLLLKSNLKSIVRKKHSQTFDFATLALAFAAFA